MADNPLAPSTRPGDHRRAVRLRRAVCCNAERRKQRRMARPRRVTEAMKASWARNVGENSPVSTLTLPEVKEIKLLAVTAVEQGWRAWVAAAANDYGVSVTTITEIMDGKTWVDARPLGWWGRFYNVRMRRKRWTRSDTERG